MTSASAPLRPRRDRHGRGQRGPMAWPPVPAMATRAERFDQLVLDAAGRMEHHAGPAMGDLEFAVEDVPASARCGRAAWSTGDRSRPGPPMLASSPPWLTTLVSNRWPHC